MGKMDRKIRRHEVALTYDGDVTRAVVAAAKGQAPELGMLVNRKDRRAQAARIRRAFWKQQQLEAAGKAPKPKERGLEPSPVRVTPGTHAMVTAMGVEQFAPPEKSVDFVPLEGRILRDLAGKHHDMGEIAKKVERAVEGYFVDHASFLRDIGWKVVASWDTPTGNEASDKPTLAIFAIDSENNPRSVKDYERALWAAAGRVSPYG